MIPPLERLNTSSLNNNQINFLWNLNNYVVVVDRISKYPQLHPDMKKKMDKNRELGFEAYYKATRIVNDKGAIETDRNAVEMANGILLYRGIPQFVNHQRLNDIEKQYGLCQNS